MYTSNSKVYVSSLVKKMDDYMYPIVDAHIHLADKAFEQDVDQVISKAKEVGVVAVLAVSESVSDFKSVLDLSDRYPDFVLPCLGLHPVQPDTEIKGPPGFGQRSVTLKDFEEAENFLELHHDKLVAIGEIGLDFTPRVCPTPEDREIQREVFRRQIRLAQKYDLPVNVHSRSAGVHVINILKEMDAKKVLLHAFDAKVSTALGGVDYGFFFSVPASICRSPQKQKLVSKIPISSLLLETDSPALSPEKMQRNVPSNITVSIEHIAQIKKMSASDVRKITTENAVKLFPRLSKFVQK